MAPKHLQFSWSEETLKGIVFSKHFTVINISYKEKTKQINTLKSLPVGCGWPVIFKYECPNPMSSNTERPCQLL